MNIKKDEIKDETPVQPPKRQIIIETDGNDINLAKAEVTGRIELVAILQSVIDYFNKKNDA